MLVDERRAARRRVARSRLALRRQDALRRRRALDARRRHGAVRAAPGRERPAARGALGRRDLGPRHGPRLQGRRQHRWHRHRRAAAVAASSRSASASSCWSSTRSSSCWPRSQFGPNLALYGVVAIFVATAAIDLVLEGVSVEKAVSIISDSRRCASAQAINHEHGPRSDSARGHRRLHGRDARHALRGALAQRDRRPQGDRAGNSTPRRWSSSPTCTRPSARASKRWRARVPTARRVPERRRNSPCSRLRTRRHRSPCPHRRWQHASALLRHPRSAAPLGGPRLLRITRITDGGGSYG